MGAPDRQHRGAFCLAKCIAALGGRFAALDGRRCEVRVDARPQTYPGGARRRWSKPDSFDISSSMFSRYSASSSGIVSECQCCFRSVYCTSTLWATGSFSGDGWNITPCIRPTSWSLFMSAPFAAGLVWQPPFCCEAGRSPVHRFFPPRGHQDRCACVATPRLSPTGRAQASARPWAPRGRAGFSSFNRRASGGGHVATVAPGRLCANGNNLLEFPHHAHRS